MKLHEEESFMLKLEETKEFSFPNKWGFHIVATDSHKNKLWLSNHRV